MLLSLDFILKRCQRRSSDRTNLKNMDVTSDFFSTWNIIFKNLSLSKTSLDLFKKQSFDQTRSFTIVKSKKQLYFTKTKILAILAQMFLKLRLRSSKNISRSRWTWQLSQSKPALFDEPTLENVADLTQQSLPKRAKLSRYKMREV